MNYENYENYEDGLFRLRDSYIKELKNLKKKLKRTKNVKFNRQIEKINDRGDISFGRLRPEGTRPPPSGATPPASQCACDLVCILKNNEWKCERKVF